MSTKINSVERGYHPGWPSRKVLVWSLNPAVASVSIKRSSETTLCWGWKHSQLSSKSSWSIASASPSFGINLTECHLIVKPEIEDSAVKSFDYKNVEIFEASRVWGSVIGSENACLMHPDERAHDHTTLWTNLADHSEVSPHAKCQQISERVFATQKTSPVPYNTQHQQSLARNWKHHCEWNDTQSLKATLLWFKSPKNFRAASETLIRFSYPQMNLLTVINVKRQ